MKTNYPSFQEVWKKYVMPLKGKILHNTKGSNKIVDVDSSGLTRTSINDRQSKIPIESFKMAYDKLIEDGEVTREYIMGKTNRCSSAIVMILKQVPFICSPRNTSSSLWLKD